KFRDLVEELFLLFPRGGELPARCERAEVKLMQSAYHLDEALGAGSPRRVAVRVELHLPVQKTTEGLAERHEHPEDGTRKPDAQAREIKKDADTRALIVRGVNELEVPGVALMHHPEEPRVDLADEI